MPFPRIWAMTLLSLTSCGSGPICSSKVLQVARDSGSDRYASTEVRSCGATTGFATIVRVGRANEAPADATEVFIADADHGAATDGGGGSIWMSVVWSAPGTLSIAYASGARVFKRLPSAKAASISYKASDPFDGLLPPA